MAQEFEFAQDWDNDGMMSLKNEKTLERFKELCEERNSMDLTKFDIFFAFSNQQFDEGLSKIRPLREGEKLVSIGGGGYGTRDGAERLFKYYDEVNEKIKKECNPQEVYCYEFNNYESCIAYDGDLEAIKYIIAIWGEEVAKNIKRKSACYSLEDILSDKN